MANLPLPHPINGTERYLQAIHQELKAVRALLTLVVRKPKAKKNDHSNDESRAGTY
jgi:hypothetical protein